MGPVTFADARLSRAYTGPEDSDFRRDTLKRLCPRDDQYDLPYDSYSVFGLLRLHDRASPAEAATRALEVLVQRPPRTKQLRATAILLGLDRDSARATGQALLEACEEVFTKEFRDLEAKKKEALEDGRPIFLVALGDAERLAQAKAAGSPLTVLSPPRSARSGASGSSGRGGGSHDECEHIGDEEEEEGDGSDSWETASLDSPPSEEQPAMPTWQDMVAALRSAATGRRAGRNLRASGGGGGGAGRFRSAPSGRNGRNGSTADSQNDSGSEEEELGGMPQELRGITPLHLAAANSDTACIQVLLKDAEERGGREGLQALLDAPVERCARYGPWEAAEGLPALHIALCMSDEPTVKLLLQAGAKLRSSGCESALHIAAMAAAGREWQPWRLQVLLELGADNLDINQLDKVDGRAALHRLVEDGELELVEMLIGAGADIGLKSGEVHGGNTPLHCAVGIGDIDIVELLLRRGADPRARNADNRTPAQLAEELGDDTLVDLLQQRQRLQRLQSHGRPGAGVGSSSFRSTGMPEDLPEDMVCTVCITQPKTTILAPCGHRCLCKRCLRAIMERDRDQRNCPVCREHIESFVVTVYE